MLIKVLPAIVEGLVSVSTGVAAESAMKLMTPARLSTTKSFLFKGVSWLAGGVISSLVADFAKKQAEEIISTITPHDLEGDKVAEELVEGPKDA